MSNSLTPSYQPGAINKLVYRNAQAIFHETFLHADMTTSDFLNNGKVDYSNISPAIKQYGPKQQNQWQHWQSNFNSPSSLWPGGAVGGLLDISNRLHLNNNVSDVKRGLFDYIGRK